MSSSEQFDPKFAPAAKLLAVVDLKATEIKSTESVLSILARNYESADRLSYQNAVLFYTLYRRGEDVNVLAGRFGETADSIKRRRNEGMAILRTQETTRTVAAVRKGALGMKAIDEATLNTSDPQEMIQNLEFAALGEGLKSYQVAGQKGSSAHTSVATAPLYTAIVQHLEEKAIPVTANAMVSAIPVFAEELNIERKQRTANPGEGGHLGLEANLKRTMDDVVAIVEAADGEAYRPTAQDLLMFLQFMDFMATLVHAQDSYGVVETAQMALANA